MQMMQQEQRALDQAYGQKDQSCGAGGVSEDHKPIRRVQELSLLCVQDLFDLRLLRYLIRLNPTRMMNLDSRLPASASRT
jgi:hypothetical protein